MEFLVGFYFVVSVCFFFKCLNGNSCISIGIKKTLCPLLLSASLGHTEKRLHPPYSLPSNIFCKMTLRSFFQADQSQLSQHFLIWQTLQSPNNLCGPWPLAVLPPVHPCVSCIEEPSTSLSTPDILYQWWLEEKDHLPPPAGQPSSWCNCRLVAFFFFVPQRALLVHVHLIVHQNCQVFLWKATFQPVGHQPLLEHELHVQDFIFPFDELDEISVILGTDIVPNIVKTQGGQGRFYKIVSSLKHSETAECSVHFFSCYQNVIIILYFPEEKDGININWKVPWLFIEFLLLCL